MRRPAVLSAAVLLVVAACSDESGSPGETSVTTPAETPASALPAPVRMTEEPGGIRRFGEGRALRAAYDTASDRTVVGTTLGLVVVSTGGEPEVLSDGLVTMLATSPDGRLAAVTTLDGRLEVWDVDRAEQVATFTVGDARFDSLSFADDGVVAGGELEVVRFELDGTTTPLFEAPDGATLGPAVVGASGQVAVPVLTPAPTVAMVTGDGTTGQLDLGLGEGARLTGVQWSGDARHLAVLYAPPAGGDTVGVWDVGAGQFAARIPVPNLVEPHQVTFPTPERLVFPNFDRVVAYDLTGTEVAAYPLGDAAVGEIDAAGDAAVISTLDGTLTRWTIDEEPAELAPRTVTLVDQRGGAAVTTVDQVGLVRVFAPDGTEQLRLDRWAVGEATAVDVGSDGSVLLATSTGAVRLVEQGVATADPAVLDRDEGDVSDVSIAPGDDRVATGVSVQKRSEAWDDTIEVTDLATMRSSFTLGGEAEDVSGCAFYEANVVFSPDGTLLASSSHDFTVQVSPLDDPGATIVLEPHLGSVLDIDFSPDGDTLVTSADDGTMRRWDVDGWHLRDELPAAPGGWFALAYSPDGALLAASDVAGAISILDPETGEVQRTLEGTRTTLGDMVFTPDGESLVAPLPDGAVGIWDVATGTIDHELRGHTLPVNGLAVSDDGTTVVTASQDGTVRTWPFP